MKGRMVFVHGLTPIHTGTGQSVDVIDLPVAREKPTNWPYIPGSSIKGVLRDAYTDVEGFPIKDLFGPDKIENDNGSAGMLLFSDARLLCLPVRSFYGTFAWTTCPTALRRLRRDSVNATGNPLFDEWTTSLVDEQAVVCTQSDLCPGGKIYLEDLDVDKAADQNADAWAKAIAEAVFESKPEQEAFMKRFAVISDDLFTVLTETATDVVARIRINDDTKTVAKGGLWYEEAVPSESIFSFPLLAAPRNGVKVFESVDKNWAGLVQIGGNASVGRGLVRLVLTKEA